MKMKKIVSLFVCLSVLMALLAGCGGSVSKNSAVYDRGMEMAEAPMAAAGAPAYDEDAAVSDQYSQSGSATLPQGRKWIITMNLSAETEDLDALTAALEAKIAALQGYVEDQNVYNGSRYSDGRRYRSASMTIRIPAEQVDAFTQDVEGIANIVRKDKNVQDITLSYVSTESRLKALQTEEDRLLELLSQAETMTDLLEIEQRLAEVRYELENYASQKRLYDNQIDYATIHLSMEEVQEYTPVEEPTLWERISKGFVGSLKGVGEDLLDLLVWIIVASPYLVVLAAVIALFLLLTRGVRRRRAAKKAAKKAAKQAAMSAEPPQSREETKE